MDTQIRRLGIGLVVVTTVIVGLIALKKGLTKNHGLVAALPQFQKLDLVDWNDLVIGGREASVEIVEPMGARVLLTLAMGAGGMSWTAIGLKRILPTSHPRARRPATRLGSNWRNRAATAGPSRDAPAARHRPMRCRPVAALHRADGTGPVRVRRCRPAPARGGRWAVRDRRR